MKQIAAIVISVLLLILTAGCDLVAPANSQQNGETPSSEFLLSPLAAPDGKPYRIAVVDLDPYAPCSQFFYSYVMRLLELGWIQAAELPISEEDTIQEMMAVLSTMDLGGLITFDKDLCFYMLYEEPAAIEAALRQAAASPEGLDVILAMGTDAGMYVKSLDLDVAMLDPMATDPVASGIIDSATDTGNPKIWALVEPDTFGRQFTYYHQMFGFKRLGMVVEPQTQDLAGIPSYEKAAAELGVTVIKKIIPADQTPKDPAGYQQALGELYQELAQKDQVDAFLLTYYTNLDPESLEKLLQPFYEAKIPVLVGDGDVFVEKGGLLCVSSYDYRSYGNFTADITSTVFHGRDAGSLPCEFVSSPRIVLNADTAEKIGFPLDFRLLQSCDVVYTGKGGI